MSNFEKVILKKVFFENLEITFWDSLKKTQTFIQQTRKVFGANPNCVLKILWRVAIGAVCASP